MMTVILRSAVQLCLTGKLLFSFLVLDQFILSIDTLLSYHWRYAKALYHVKL